MSGVVEGGFNLSASRDLRFEELQLTIPGKHKVKFSGVVRSGERVVLSGPSGIGKTTFLRGLAGLCPFDRGKFYLGEQELSQWKPQKIRAGLVFQSGALFPHLTVLENVCLALKYSESRSKEPSAKHQSQVRQELDALGLAALELRLPDQLSGGEKQRVALLRALLSGANFFLLDEPLAHLDGPTKAELVNWIIRTVEKRGVPMLIVTHDADEVRMLGTRSVTWKVGQECVIF